MAEAIDNGHDNNGRRWPAIHGGISLGNVLTIFWITISVSVAYAAMKADIAAVQASLTTFERDTGAQIASIEQQLLVKADRALSLPLAPAGGTGGR